MIIVLIICDYLCMSGPDTCFISCRLLFISVWLLNPIMSVCINFIDRTEAGMYKVFISSAARMYLTCVEFCRILVSCTLCSPHLVQLFSNLIVLMVWWKRLGIENDTKKVLTDTLIIVEYMNIKYVAVMKIFPLTMTDISVPCSL